MAACAPTLLLGAEAAAPLGSECCGGVLGSPPRAFSAAPPKAVLTSSSPHKISFCVRRLDCFLPLTFTDRKWEWRERSLESRASRKDLISGQR